MLFHLDFNVEYPSTMQQKELFAIWAREADHEGTWPACTDSSDTAAPL